MACYDYKCKTCGRIEEQIHFMNERPEIKCSICGGVMEKQFTPNIGGFIMKGGTEASHWKEKRTRMSKRESLGVKQRERYGTGPKIQPNVAGMEVDSWKDAQSVAKEAGLNTQSYEPYVQKEKSKLIV
jgi:putative regulatory protein, FmdB family